jgi:hypothetical protein
MLGFIAKFRLKAFLKRQNLTRLKAFKNWDQIDKIALILSNSDNINKSKLDQFVEQSKKHVEVYFIELNAKQGSFSDWICFTKSSKNSLGLMSKNVAQIIAGKKYDLVIDTSTNNKLFSANLSSSLVAPFKCGASNSFDQNDLIIMRNKDQDLLSYLNEVIRYISMIHN